MGNRVLGKKVQTVLKSLGKEEEQQMTEEAADEPSGIWPVKLFGPDLPVSVPADTHGSNLALFP